MRKLIFTIALCFPLIASAQLGRTHCLGGLTPSCPQPFEEFSTTIDQEQALKIASQAIALVWDRSIPDGYKDVMTWLSSCENISTKQAESDGGWKVTYAFDEGKLSMVTINVFLQHTGYVVMVESYACGIYGLGCHKLR